MLHSRCGRRRTPASRSTAERRAGGARGARPDGGVRRRVRSGAWRGHRRARSRTVVNIGIGGSPTSARRWRTSALRRLRATGASTLPVRVQRRRRRHRHEPRRPRSGDDAVRRRSKTFTTIETLTNARSGADVAGRRRSASDAVADSTSSRCRTNAERGRRVRHRHRRTCSGSGTGSAAGTRSTPRSVCR